MISPPIHAIGRQAVMIYANRFRCRNSSTKIRGASLRGIGKKKVFTSCSQFLQAANSAVYPFALSFSLESFKWDCESQPIFEATVKVVSLSGWTPTRANFCTANGDVLDVWRPTSMPKILLNKNNLFSLQKGSLWKRSSCSNFEMLTLTLIVFAPSSSSIPQGRPRKNRIFDLVQKCAESIFVGCSGDPMTLWIETCIAYHKSMMYVSAYMPLARPFPQTSSTLSRSQRCASRVGNCLAKWIRLTRICWH